MTPWHFQSKLNKVRIPSSPWGDGAGMKIREYNTQIPPSPVDIPPFICMPLITGLLNRPRTAAPHLLLTFRLRAYSCSNELLLYFLSFLASSLKSFLIKKETLTHQEQELSTLRERSHVSWPRTLCLDGSISKNKRIITTSPNTFCCYCFWSLWLYHRNVHGLQVHRTWGYRSSGL